MYTPANLAPDAEMVANDSNRKLLNRTGAIVAVLLVLVLASALAALIHYDIPKDNHDIILVLVTVIANSVTGVVGYFFGSSVSQTRQGDIIATQAQTASKLADTAAAAAGTTTTTTTASSTQSELKS